MEKLQGNEFLNNSQCQTPVSDKSLYSASAFIAASLLSSRRSLARLASLCDVVDTGHIRQRFAIELMLCSAADSPSEFSWRT